MKRLLLVVWLMCGLLVAAPVPIYTDPPARTPHNLVVGFYNIQWFGRLPHDLQQLAKVINTFDICGIVEIAKVSELVKLTEVLNDLTPAGGEWGYAHGVRTARPGGTYYETFGVVWRRDRVQLGDGVISIIWDRDEVFRNDPYLASFRWRQLGFTMVLLHTRWSDDSAGTRAGEVVGIGKQLTGLANQLEHTNFLLAGDFNYEPNDPIMRQLARRHRLVLRTPHLPTTFRGDFLGYSSCYDHLYTLKGSTLDGAVRSQGVMDVTYFLHGELTPVTLAKTRRELSDHLPIWLELHLPQ